MHIFGLISNESDLLKKKLAFAKLPVEEKSKFQRERGS